ncbi:hypothetical protein LIT25_03050 [Bacillus sp. F19]|nr:hypothetical protein LIT25_03050 [Bacillus sp. F19]
MDQINDFSWNGHSLTNEELQMFNEGLKELLNDKSMNKLNEVAAYMTEKYGEADGTIHSFITTRKK